MYVWCKHSENNKHIIWRNTETITPWTLRKGTVISDVLLSIKFMASIYTYIYIKQWGAITHP